VREWELDERETAVLTLAARQADAVAKLERSIAKEGFMVRGSRGQPVLNPAITETHQARLAVGQLKLPDEDGNASTAASVRGQRAARARWGQLEELRQRRGA
jgi:hypothetical protein